jgi:fucose permease
MAFHFIRTAAPVIIGSGVGFLRFNANAYVTSSLK